MFSDSVLAVATATACRSYETDCRLLRLMFVVCWFSFRRSDRDDDDSFHFSHLGLCRCCPPLLQRQLSDYVQLLDLCLCRSYSSSYPIRQVELFLGIRGGNFSLSRAPPWDIRLGAFFKRWARSNPQQCDPSSFSLSRAEANRDSSISVNSPRPLRS